MKNLARFQAMRDSYLRRSLNRKWSLNQMFEAHFLGALSAAVSVEVWEDCLKSAADMTDDIDGRMSRNVQASESQTRVNDTKETT